MKLPTPLGFPALTVGLLLTASTAVAQPITFDQIDANDDGILSETELLAALGSAALLDFDEDNDGLSEDDLREAADDGDNGLGNSGGFDPSNPAFGLDDEDDEGDDDVDETDEGDDVDETDEGDDVEDEADETDEGDDVEDETDEGDDDVEDEMDDEEDEDEGDDSSDDEDDD